MTTDIHTTDADSELPTASSDLSGLGNAQHDASDIEPTPTSGTESEAKIQSERLATDGEAFTEEDLKQQLESVIFASDEVISTKLIRIALNNDQLSDEHIAKLVAELNHAYEESGRTFRIHRIAQGYRFLTEKQFHRPIQRLLQPKLARRLSQAALETLAIVAYKQPITKAEIEAIRGTNADYVIRVLLEKNLIEVCGRSEGVGKALLYGTTKEFLDYFNLHTLAELPKPREIEEIMREGDAQDFLKQELNARLKVELERDAEQDETKAKA